jgi:hypothetical protein
MSGGEYDYIYSKVERECADRMYDAEMNALIKDLVTVLKAVEWWQSGDTSEADYREEVAKFKKKWLKSRRLKGDGMKNLMDELSEKIMNM